MLRCATTFTQQSTGQAYWAGDNEVSVHGTVVPVDSQAAAGQSFLLRNLFKPATFSCPLRRTTERETQSLMRKLLVLANPVAAGGPSFPESTCASYPTPPAVSTPSGLTT